MKFAGIFFTISSLLLSPGCFSGSNWGNAQDYLKQAEEATRRESWEEAIASYRSHMERRLLVTKRPDWENPWFYLLMIGDIELGREQPTEAVQTYQEAFDRGIEKGLVSDRIRLVATWYEQRGQLAQAIELLSRHREKDELLFDIMLDRISRELTSREDTLPQVQATPTL